MQCQSAEIGHDLDEHAPKWQDTSNTLLRVHQVEAPTKHGFPRANATILRSEKASLSGNIVNTWKVTANGHRKEDTASNANTMSLPGSTNVCSATGEA
jgi:hypothetical protein